MTKERLSKYLWLNREIKKQERRRDRLAASGRVVADVVHGSASEFPYAERKFKIVGSPDGIIAAIDESIERNIAEAAEELLKITEYINQVGDPQLRELLRGRFVDCLKWEDVGRQNYISPDYARSLVNNFIKESS